MFGNIVIRIYRVLALQHEAVILFLPPIMIVVLDFVYAVTFPFNFLCFGEKLHELYLSKEVTILPQF